SVQFWPADPERVLDLLSIPLSPIPRGMAGPLSRALHQLPAVDSDEWRDRREASLAQLRERTSPRDAGRISRWARDLVEGSLDAMDATTPALHLDAILKRVEMVRSWQVRRRDRERRRARERGEAVVRDTRVWTQAISQADILPELLVANDEAEVSAVTI